MAQSLSNVLVHLVFSTKHRRPLIDASIENDLHAYLAGIAKRLDCPAHKIGGVEDHVHVACTLARTKTVACLVQELKQASSKWIKTRGEAYRSFAWQDGYGAFSVSQSHLDDLRRYIANQRQHHRQESYQDEFRKTLNRYRIEYDEHYVWD